jgi:hypothetical protein
MGADFTSLPAQEAAIEALCATIQQRCAGDNVQYESVASCEDILGKRNFGSWDEVWGDNVVCRSVHVGLTMMRPEVSYYDLSLATVEIIVFPRWSRQWRAPDTNTGFTGSLSPCRANRCDEVRRCTV